MRTCVCSVSVLFSSSSSEGGGLRMGAMQLPQIKETSFVSQNRFCPVRAGLPPTDKKDPNKHLKSRTLV